MIIIRQTSLCRWIWFTNCSVFKKSFPYINLSVQFKVRLHVLNYSLKCSVLRAYNIGVIGKNVVVVMEFSFRLLDTCKQEFWELITNFTEDQLNVAFTNEGEFISFLQMMATAWTNEIEKTLEEKSTDTLEGTWLSIFTINFWPQTSLPQEQSQMPSSNFILW